MMSMYENVDFDGLLAKMDRKSFVIDVRENNEIAATGSLPNSVNIPRNNTITYILNNSIHTNVILYSVILCHFLGSIA